MWRIRWVRAGVIAVVLLGGASCGDDEGGAAPPPADQGAGDTAGDDAHAEPSDSEDEAPSAPSGGGGGGGVLTLGSETIELDRARCFLEEQPAAGGGGSIELTGQGMGTNAAGDEVVVDFTRYSDDSMFAGDDVTIDVGDPRSDDFRSFGASLDTGTVSLDGNVLSASDIPFTDWDDGSEMVGSFRIEC
jgi:hypothetical protein